MMAARVAGVPRPFSRIASRSSSSSIELARAFHRRQQRRFVEARRAARVCERDDLDLARSPPSRRPATGDQVRRVVVALRFLAVHGEPARADQHLALGLERLAFDARDARGDQVLGRRDRTPRGSAHDEVVELGSRPRSGASAHQRRDDREVIGDLAVVEDALVRAAPTSASRISRAKPPIRVGLGRAPPASP